jgi:hypothetical protein
MLIVRPYNVGDLEAVTALHKRQGHNYDLPDPATAMIGTVIEEDHVLKHALFLRKTLEAYWLFDPANETRRDTIARMLVLNKEVPRAARKLGFTDVFCWVPPDVSNKSFDQTLVTLGWTKPLWTCYAKDITHA